MATTKKNAADKSLKTYPVLNPLEHDGERYAVGDTVELTEAQADALQPHTVGDAIATPAA